MSFIFRTTLAFFTLTMLGSCAHEFALNVNDAVVADKVVKISGSSLVDKEGKFNVKTIVTNLGDKYLLIRLNDIQCYKGEHAGTVQHAFFGAGERDINFAPHQTKPFNFLCYFGGIKHPVGPDYKFVFSKVFENPSHDGRTPGKVLASNVTWTIKNRE